MEVQGLEFQMNEYGWSVPFDHSSYSFEYPLEVNESQSQSVPIQSSYFTEAIHSISEQTEQEEGLNYDELLDLEMELHYNCGMHLYESHHSQVGGLSPVINALLTTSNHRVLEQPFVSDVQCVPDLQEPFPFYQQVTNYRCHSTSSGSDTECSLPPSPAVETCTQHPLALTQAHATSSGCSVTSTRRAVRPRRRQRQLCKFLMDTLDDAQYSPTIIEWINRDAGVFRFVQPRRVAELWGERRRRQNMTYEHLSRAMRYYYTRGIMKRVVDHGRLVYQFLQLNDETTTSASSNAFSRKSQKDTSTTFNESLTWTY